MADSVRRVSLLSTGLTLTMPVKKDQRTYATYINETPPGSPPPGTTVPNYQLNIQIYNQQIQSQKLKEANLVTPETSPEHEEEADTYCQHKTPLKYHGASPVFDLNWTPERKTRPPQTTPLEKQSTSAAKCQTLPPQTVDLEKQNAFLEHQAMPPLTADLENPSASAEFQITPRLTADLENLIDLTDFQITLPMAADLENLSTLAEIQITPPPTTDLEKLSTSSECKATPPLIADLDLENPNTFDRTRAAEILFHIPGCFTSPEEEEKPPEVNLWEGAPGLDGVVGDECVARLLASSEEAAKWVEREESQHAPPVTTKDESPMCSPFLWSNSDSENPKSPGLLPSMSSVLDYNSFHSFSPPSKCAARNINGWESAPFELDLHGLCMPMADQLSQDKEQTLQQKASPSPSKVEQHTSPAQAKCMRPVKKAKRFKMSKQHQDHHVRYDNDLKRSCSEEALASTTHMLVASTSKSNRLTGGPDVRIHGFINHELPTDHNSYCAPPKTPTPATVRKFPQSPEGAIVVVKEANGKLNTTVAGPCPTDFSTSKGILAQVGHQRKRKTFVKPVGTARISKATQAKRSRHIPNAEETVLLAKREKHKLSERQRRYKSAQGILQAQNYIVQIRGKDFFVNKTSHGKTNKVKKISKQSTLDTCKKLILELQTSPSALLCELCDRNTIVASKFNQLCAERRKFGANQGYSVASDLFSEEFDLIATQVARLRKHLHLFQSRSGTRVSATN